MGTFAQKNGESQLKSTTSPFSREQSTIQSPIQMQPAVHQNSRLATAVQLQQKLNQSPQVQRQTALATALSNRSSTLQPTRTIQRQELLEEEELMETQPDTDSIQLMSASVGDLPEEDEEPVQGRFEVIQRKSIPGASNATDVETEAIRTAALAGVRAPVQRFPFAEQIQRSFGKHDISQIQSHTGSDATNSAKAMNAKAFATGNHVVFGGTPDIRTAAHEAAHVIQQQAGVHLAGGVGKVGDVYEQHADAVAERVAAGRSAEDLLNQFAGKESSAAEPTIQRATLTTYGGTFTDTGYAAMDINREVDPTRVGCSMLLRFEIFPFVACEKYGLVQMVDYQDDGAPAYPAGWPDTQNRAVNPGQFIDKKQEYINPVFTGGNPVAIFQGQASYNQFLLTLDEEQSEIIEEKAETDDDSGWVIIDVDFSRAQRITLGDVVMGVLGEHMEPATGLGYPGDRDVLTFSGRGTDLEDDDDDDDDEEEEEEEEEGNATRPAMMYDRPSHPMTQTRLAQDAVTSSRRFETAALCIKGTMDGTYLGSVEWGFYTRNDQIHLYPFRIVSMGSPSLNFQAAAQGWNQSTVTMGNRQVAPMQLPANSAAPVAAAPATRDALATRINQVRGLIHGITPPVGEAQINQMKNLRLEAGFLMVLVFLRAGDVAAADDTVAIQHGESLRDFAFRTTGNRDNWVEIMALNRNVMNTLTGPQVNQQLRIPRAE